MNAFDQPLVVMRRYSGTDEEWDILRDFNGEIEVFDNPATLFERLYFSGTDKIELAVLSCYQDVCFFINPVETEIVEEG